MRMWSKRSVLGTLLVSTLVLGAATMLAPSQGWSTVIDILAFLSISFLVFAWYCADARERAFRRKYWQDFGVAAATLIGLPIYLFRSRGARGGALATGGAVLIYALMLALVVVGGVFGLVVRAILGMPMPGLA